MSNVWRLISDVSQSPSLIPSHSSLIPAFKLICGAKIKSAVFFMKSSHEKKRRIMHPTSFLILVDLGKR